MNVIAQLHSAIREITAAIGEDFLVLAVFFVACGVLQLYGLGFVKKKSRKSVPAPSCAAPDEPSKKTVSERPAGNSKAKAGIRGVETQMLKLLEQREFTRALSVFKILEKDGRVLQLSENMFFTFMESAIRVGSFDVFERLLHAAKRRGLEPGSDFFRAILRMLSSRKQYDECLRVYNTFASVIPSDKVVFSCLINAALETGEPQRAASMLPSYLACELESREYVLVLRTHVATNNVEAAKSVFWHLRETMNSLLLNLVLLACVNAKQVECAMEFLHAAQQFDRNRQAALPEGERMVDVVSYNTVIKGFAKDGWQSRCFTCLQEMRENGIQPDEVTCGTLLDMCITANEENAANTVANFLANVEWPMDTVMCTLFIKGFLRAKQLQKALCFYEEMKRQGCKNASPDVITYSLLIKALVDKHDLKRALCVLEDMMAAGHLPDDIILTHLLEGCRYAAKHSLGKKLFKDVIAAGVTPSGFTLMGMIKLHGRCGAHAEAYQLVANSEKEYGLKPTVMHYTCLMSGCLHAKKYEKAWAAFELMIEHGVAPDSTTMEILLPGMVNAQKWDRVMNLARRSLEPDTEMPVAPDKLNLALSQIALAQGQQHHADELRDLMQEAGVQIRPRRPKPANKQRTSESGPSQQ